MKTIVQIFFIAAVLFLGYTIATADGPLVNITTTDPAPPVIVVPAPVTAPEPAATAVPVVYPVIIPNPPNPDPAAFITPEAAAVAAPVEAVFTLTDGRWVDDQNAQFLTDCAYNIAKGLAHDPNCPANSAALLGVGR
jgi:hypothetical protein